MAGGQLRLRGVEWAWEACCKPLCNAAKSVRRGEQRKPRGASNLERATRQAPDWRVTRRGCWRLPTLPSPLVSAPLSSRTANAMPYITSHRVPQRPKPLALLRLALLLLCLCASHLASAGRPLRENGYSRRLQADSTSGEGTSGGADSAAPTNPPAKVTDHATTSANQPAATAQQSPSGQTGGTSAAPPEKQAQPAAAQSPPPGQTESGSTAPPQDSGNKSQLTMQAATEQSFTPLRGRCVRTGES